MSTLPRNLVEEIELELADAQRHLRVDHERVARLRDLLAISTAVTAALGRDITVFDLVRAAGDACERNHRTQLLHTLRDHGQQRPRS